MRQYQLSEMEFGMVSRSLGKEGLREGEVLVEKPGFESRFFEGGGSWHDCTKRVAAILRDEEFSGTALMDRKMGKLVMKAEEADHEDFATMVRVELPRQLRLKAAVYGVPGVVSGMRSVDFFKEDEGTKLLGEISLVALPGQPGQAQTAGGELKVETEMQIDANDGIAEIRATISGRPRGVEFSMKSGFAIPLGMPWVVELGSVTGGKSLVMVVGVDSILLDGTREDAWVLKEEGGEFLRERRLRGIKSFELPKQEGEFREYAVPPTFFTFIGGGNPFAGEPKVGGGRLTDEMLAYQREYKELARAGLVYDIEFFLKQNGISFREGDFAFYSKLRGMIYAKLSVISQELLKGIVICGEPDSPRMIRFDFEQVDGKGTILQKLGGLALPGQTATVSLGEDLKVELEAQIDANDSIVETRFKLTESGGDLERPSLQTGVVLQNGISSVVQTAFSGERKSWRLTATIVAVEDVVGSYLEGAK